MKSLLLLIIFSIVFLLSSTYIVFAGESVPPHCIGNVCFGEHIEKYTDRVEMVGKHVFGPLAILKNEGRYVSARLDEMDESNWVQLSFCDSPGVIKTIHRTIKSMNDSEYYDLLTAYEKKYGKSETPEYGKSNFELWHEWKWKEPKTDLILMKKRDSNYISIELHNREIALKDAECTDREILEWKSKEGLVPN